MALTSARHFSLIPGDGNVIRMTGSEIACDRGRHVYTIGPAGATPDRLIARVIADVVEAAVPKGLHEHLRLRFPLQVDSVVGGEHAVEELERLRNFFRMETIAGCRQINSATGAAGLGDETKYILVVRQVIVVDIAERQEMTLDAISGQALRQIAIEERHMATRKSIEERLEE